MKQRVKKLLALAITTTTAMGILARCGSISADSGSAGNEDIEDSSAAAETLVATEESGITSVEDLAGRTVATLFASTVHYSLLNALTLAGLSETDVTVLDMQPDDIYAACGICAS